MSDPFDDFESYEEDIGVEVEDKKHATGSRPDWFKSEKGRSHLVSFVYFHPIVIAAAIALKKKMAKEGKVVTKDQLREIGEKALAKVAEGMGKDVDSLTDADKLDINSAKFKKWVAHYKEGLGYVHSRLGLDGDDADKVWKLLGDTRNYFGTLLLVYPTELGDDGELTIDKNRLAKGWNLIPWRLSTKSYEIVHKLNQGLRKNSTDLAHQDIRLDCTNTGYQNFDVVGNGPAVWRKSDKFRIMVLEKAVKLYDKLDPFRRLSTADLKVKLGIDDGRSAVNDDAVDDGQYDDIINNV